MSEERPRPKPAAVAAPQHALSADDVDAFLDGLMPAALNTAEVPGAWERGRRQ